MPVRNYFSSEAPRQLIFLSSSFTRLVAFLPFPPGSLSLPRILVYGTLLLVITVSPAAGEPAPASPETFVTVVEPESEAPNLADCPNSCDLATCPLETLKNEDACPSGTRVLDTCGCCPVCLRMVNETCGGKLDRFGICSNGLSCRRKEDSTTSYDGTSKVQGPERFEDATSNLPAGLRKAGLRSAVGTCSGMWSEECVGARCAVVFQPQCAEDSFLVVTPPEPPDCCQKLGSCVCNQKKCLEAVSKCDAGFALTRVHKGTNQPGDCCDTYECKKRVLDCEGVICPEVEILDCPQDSYRPPIAVIQGTCCPLTESCKCLPGICAPVHCPPGRILEVTKKGDGIPGSCCDEFQCTPNVSKADGAAGNSDRETIMTNSERVSDDKNKAETEKDTGDFDSKQRRTVDMSLNPIAQKPCLHEGGFYHDGQKWYPNLCSECECQVGVTFCRKMTCPRVPESCTWVEAGERECCPLCLGCVTEEGRKVNLTERWDKDDCTSCTCGEAGTVLCQTQLCRVTCDNPVKVEGRCCPICEKPTVVTMPPVCPSIEHCPLRCEYGLKKDDRGCFLCACDHIPDEDISIFGLNCKPLNQKNCIKKCAHGYVHDENGCAICVCARCPPLHQCYKHCLYGFQKNAYGCPVCKCKSRMLPKDPKTKESTKNNNSIPSLFPGGSPTEETGLKFPEAVLCHGPHGQKHDSGEWWHDGCRHCYCEHGQEYCSLIACPKLECGTDYVIRNSSDCCSRCKNETLSSEKHSHTVCHAPGSGRLFVDGETWDLTPCVRCTCRVGHVLCYVQPCPPVVCAKPVKRGCCEVCEEEDITSQNHLTEFDDNLTICTSDSGVAHVQWSTWRVDECTSCMCKENGIECFPEVCEWPVLDPETQKECRTRPLRIKGRCCPMCTDSLSKGLCQYGKTYYAIGEEWKDGNCINCSCTEGGQTLCTKLECPPCQIPKEVVGRCCPICEENVPSWSLRPTLYPPDSGNYNETQQINLILLFSVLGLALVIVLVIVAICLCYKIRCRSAAEEKKKQAQMEHHGLCHGGGDPLIPGTLLAPQTPATPGLTVTTSGPLLSGQGSFSAKLLRVKEPRSEQSVSLLSATSNGSSGSSTNGTQGPTSPNGCARAASFNLKKIAAPCTESAGQRPRSCKV